MKTKILISSDGFTAHYYIRLGLARALNAYGYEARLWDCKNVPATDAFDKFKPDVFFGQGYNLTPTLVNVIKESPWIKVILKVGDWGNITKEVSNKYPILVATEEEKRNVNAIRDQVSFLHCHHHPDWLYQTHGFWKEDGYEIESIINAADIFDYCGGKFNESFKSDLCFIGGYWPYKSKTLDSYILNLCSDFKYNIKIFGNQPWPCPQYCGFIPNQHAKDMLFSSTICPNISERHSQEFGYDVIERPFKLLANKCFVISDYVEGLFRLFPNEIVYAKTSNEFGELVDHYLNNPEERVLYTEKGYEKVLKYHTYLDRAKHIMEKLGFYNQFDQIKENVIKGLGL